MKSSVRGDSPLSLALSCCVSVRRLERSPVTPVRCPTDFPGTNVSGEPARRLGCGWSPAFIRLATNRQDDRDLRGNQAMIGWLCGTSNPATGRGRVGNSNTARIVLCWRWIAGAEQPLLRVAGRRPGSHSYTTMYASTVSSTTPCERRESSPTLDVNYEFGILREVTYRPFIFQRELLRSKIYSVYLGATQPSRERAASSMRSVRMVKRP